jgi:hypothetical protein
MARKKEWKFNVDEDIHFIDFFKGQEPSKKRVLAHKRKTRPSYEWKISDLKMSRGFRLFFRKK